MGDVKQAKKVFSRLGWCYLAGTAAVYVLQLVLGYVIAAFRPEWFESMNFTLILSSLTVYAFGMPVIVLLTYGMEKDKIERHRMKWWEFLVAMTMCYSLVFISNMAGTVITTMIGQVKGSAVENKVVDYITESDMLVNFVLMVVVAPIVEEYVFRKVIVDRTIRYGQGFAIVTSGLMFGLFHGNLNQFAYAVVLGGFFAFIYARTGKLKITIAMHAIVNFMGSMIAGLLLKLLHYDELISLSNSDSYNLDTMMQFVRENIIGWVLYVVYAQIIFSIVIMGVSFFLLYFKRFKLIPGREQIPSGKKFSVLFLNPGMIVFCLVWMVLIVVQLLA